MRNNRDDGGSNSSDSNSLSEVLERGSQNELSRESFSFFFSVRAHWTYLPSSPFRLSVTTKSKYPSLGVGMGKVAVLARTMRRGRSA